MMPVEWKDGPKGARTPEQKALEDDDRIAVAWDTPSFFAAIYQFECYDPRIEPHPLLRAWTERGSK